MLFIQKRTSAAAQVQDTLRRRQALEDEERHLRGARHEELNGIVARTQALCDELRSAHKDFDRAALDGDGAVMYFLNTRQYLVQPEIARMWQETIGAVRRLPSATMALWLQATFAVITASSAHEGVRSLPYRMVSSNTLVSYRHQLETAIRRVNEALQVSEVDASVETLAIVRALIYKV